ncbi:hypothetical protein ACUN0C_15185 [Faunimonas sp. B44]|uniref:hypothetical protein n=1 Tax=Faunimonas sp. B44 TaxID=3461493 RepID=UPI004043BDF7
MGTRGRRSSAELTLAPVVLAERRPSPPPSLTDAEAAVWVDVVGAMPATWFTKAARPVLVNYVRHVVRGELLAQQVAAFDPDWLGVEGGLDRLDKLLRMAERETKAATACARALRLTPQSQILPRTAGTAVARQPDGPRPWE